MGGKEGVKVVEVQKGGAAEAAGLKAGDILSAVGTENVRETDQAVKTIRSRQPGSTVQFTVARSGQSHSFAVTLAEMTVDEWVPFYVNANNAHEVRWLVRNHALTVLPSVSSLKALRRFAKPSGASKPLIGFGNPLLDGDQDHPLYGNYYKKQAALAREKQRCGETTIRDRIASLLGLRGGVARIETRGGLADLDQLRTQQPLPETADELCTVARNLKADASEVLLGAGATEHKVKALSASGALANYRIVHFATHGALAGQINGASEPGLILSPPVEATEDDDGYLSASEIAGLKLDADWVILSACNTAAGGAKGAEALSGLARAFFYAQARAMLVSHWAVNSDVTVKLITGAVSRLAADKTMGRAEAMRQAMLALIDNGGPEAHPAYWAPFVVVGEGGAAK